MHSWHASLRHARTLLNAALDERLLKPRPWQPMPMSRKWPTCCMQMWSRTVRPRTSSQPLSASLPRPLALRCSCESNSLEHVGSTVL